VARRKESDVDENSGDLRVPEDAGATPFDIEIAEWVTRAHNIPVPAAKIAAWRKRALREMESREGDERS
jgi:hypothetical protein